MARYYLGLDSSTQSLTAVVINVENREIVCEASVSFDAFQTQYGTQSGVVIEREKGTRSGERVWSYPLMWLEALDRLCERLAGCQEDQGFKLSEIGAVSGSGQQHGTVYLNAHADKLLGSLEQASTLKEGLAGMLARERSPIWMDSSTGQETQEIEAGVGGRHRLLELTGNVAFARFSGPQIRRIARDEPAVYDATKRICLVSSFMASVLAGQVAPIDPGDGAGMNLMDIQQRKWNTTALEATAAGLGEKLLPIQPTENIVGKISPYFVKRFGFSPDCQVALWSGDNPCSLIGLGLVKSGTAAISLGSSDVLFTVMDQPRPCTSGEGALFASPAGQNMGLLCFSNGDFTRRAIRDQFGLNWKSFSSLLKDSSAGNPENEKDNDSPRRMLLPYLRPEIAPLVPRQMLVYHQLSPMDAAGCVRAVVESRALATRIHSEWCGERFTRLRVTGGGSSNREMVQVFADVFNAPVETLHTTSTAALGAALMAWHAHTRVDWATAVAPFTRPAESRSPIPANVAVYAEMLEEYRELERRHT